MKFMSLIIVAGFLISQGALGAKKAKKAEKPCVVQELTMVSLSVDVVSDRARKHHEVSDSGVLVFDQLLRGSKNSGSQTSLTCKVPVRMVFAGNMKKFNDSLTTRLNAVDASNEKDDTFASGIKSDPSSKMTFTTGFYAANGDEVEALSQGKLDDFFTKYTIGNEKRIAKFDPNTTVSFQNEKGMGFIIPVEQEFKEAITVTIDPVKSDYESNAMCSNIKQCGFKLKR